jgi:hypothetical protein
MDECLPGINNVCQHVRPFSLIAWIFWKFHKIAATRGLNSLTSEQLRVWREKIEILYTWSHVLNGVWGIPGTLSATPSTSGYVPLDFPSWKRNPDSTSLMAAIQYGPAAKSGRGLAFIEPTESGLFRATGYGIELAEALEKCLDGVGRKRLLQDIEPATALAKEVSDLYEHWSLKTPSAKEKKGFRSAFYSAGVAGEDSRLGSPRGSPRTGHVGSLQNRPC